jgi:hypothetical protein
MNEIDNKKIKQRRYFKTYYILNRERILKRRREINKLHKKERDLTKRPYNRYSDEMYQKVIKKYVWKKNIVKVIPKYKPPPIKKIQKTKSLILSFDD